jgi:uncharacterized NAD-dependent epimerase/dehydratase family protein
VRLALNQRVAILLHEGIVGTTGKTGMSLIRYSEAPIVVAIDRENVGKSLKELTGIKRDVPIVRSVSDALKYEPQILVIGMIIGTKLKMPYWGGCQLSMVCTRLWQIFLS